MCVCMCEFVIVYVCELVCGLFVCVCESLFGLDQSVHESAWPSSPKSGWILNEVRVKSIYQVTLLLGGIILIK